MSARNQRNLVRRKTSMTPSETFVETLVEATARRDADGDFIGPLTQWANKEHRGQISFRPGLNWRNPTMILLAIPAATNRP